MEEEILQTNIRSELPEWIITLMRAYKEYTDILEAENGR
jgi:hypothetical protein